MDLAVVGGSLSLFSYSAVAAAVAEMAVAVVETAAVVVAATMVAAAADADLTANKRRRSITSSSAFFYLSSFSKRFSRRFTIVFSAFMRAYFFIVALKYRPWCYICGGKCYHAVNIFLIGVPLFTVAPILIGYLPTLFRRVLTLVKNGGAVRLYLHSPRILLSLRPNHEAGFQTRLSHDKPCSHVLRG